MSTITLTQGKVAIVDDADYEAISKFKWCAVRWGNTWCAMRNEKHDTRPQRTVYMHRQVMGVAFGDKSVIDHINHDGLDNRRVNLRICTGQQNQWNYTKPAGTSSQYKGVCKHKSGGWTAHITVGQRRMYLGYFACEVDAARAYNDAAQQHFGQFAKLNTIPGETICKSH